jgi:hypothetical protein
MVCLAVEHSFGYSRSSSLPVSIPGSSTRPVAGVIAARSTACSLLPQQCNSTAYQQSHLCQIPATHNFRQASCCSSNASCNVHSPHHAVTHTLQPAHCCRSALLLAWATLSGTMPARCPLRTARSASVSGPAWSSQHQRCSGAAANHGAAMRSCSGTAVGASFCPAVQICHGRAAVQRGTRLELTMCSSLPAKHIVHRS